MGIDSIQPLLDWVAQHPTAAGAAIFVTALAEALVVVGLFVPAAPIMFGVGALVASGALDLWAALGWAVAGAVAGDGISYWLGHRYRDELRNLRPLRRRPEWIAHGESYFRCHGAKSILLARFIGPLRPIIPAVAGMLGMPPRRFYMINVLSALCWAPAYLLPGVVFGASLALAGAVATRLAVLIAALVLSVWVAIWLTRRAVWWLQRRLERGLPRLQAWAESAAAGKRSYLRGFVAAWVDPARPETRALLVSAAVLIVAALALVALIETLAARDSLVWLDRPVSHVVQGLRTPVGDAVMVALTELGDAAVIAPVVLGVLLWLAWQRAWRPARYWLAAVGVGASLSWALDFAVQVARLDASSANAFSFPSAHAVMSLVTFGFLAVLLAREVSMRWRWTVFAALLLPVLLIAFAGLYLGAHRLSDVMKGLAFGGAWVALLGIAYARHPEPVLAPRALAIVAMLALSIGAGWHVTTSHAADVARYAAHQQTRTLSQQAWWTAAWQELPAWRFDLAGEYEQPMTVQWAGALAPLRRTLLAKGWQEPVPAAGRNLLLWLDTTRPAVELPVLPRVHDGRHEALVLVYPVANQPQQRLVLRLWPAGVVLQDVGRPLWIGMVLQETMRRPLASFNWPRDDTDFNRPRQVLFESLAAVPARLVTRDRIARTDAKPVTWDGQTVLVKELAEDSGSQRARATRRGHTKLRASPVSIRATLAVVFVSTRWERA
ncbi:MAG TPA: VTT domain-containing protein [Burkholderiaceae bacterium]|nr:VTT domain-containing protein [Burkholderiaceae bacterium]